MQLAIVGQLFADARVGHHEFGGVLRRVHLNGALPLVSLPQPPLRGLVAGASQ